MPKFYIFLFTFLYSPSLWAAASNTSKYNLPSEQHYKQETGWSLLVPSFVIHGIKPIGGAEEDMPRKMDSSGTSVVTPGLGLEYTSPEDGATIMAAAFKDCYNGLAGALQMGQMFRINQEMNWGFTVGVYARQTPLTCETTTSFNGEVIEECRSLDGLDWGMKARINGSQVDILPMPFLHFSYAILDTRFMRVNLRLISNMALNEFGLSIPF